MTLQDLKNEKYRMNRIIEDIETPDAIRQTVILERDKNQSEIDRIERENENN